MVCNLEIIAGQKSVCPIYIGRVNKDVKIMGYPNVGIAVDKLRKEWPFKAEEFEVVRIQQIYKLEEVAYQLQPF